MFLSETITQLVLKGSLQLLNIPKLRSLEPKHELEMIHSFDCYYY